ncbi:MAG: helix-turn-helix domain-containing protein [Syntrophobacterales bacterium]|nr:helix-turn-helix domain-containing protein [Syntrophobacterales bacterium]
MVIIKGKTYYTTTDAAKTLGVSAKTIRSYISRGIIPRPPEVRYGLRLLKHFPLDYMEKAKKLLEDYRCRKMP